MPGLNFICTSGPLDTQRAGECNRRLKHFENYQIEEILSSSNFHISFSAYDGYPSFACRGEDFLFFLEGLIYNQTKKAIEDKIRQIVERYRGKGDYESLIRAFIGSSDGDFMAILFLEKEQAALIFNDCWSRLQTFYAINDCNFVLSREIKYILPWLSSITPDKVAMAEILTLEYNLGEKTIINGLKRLRPGSMIHVYRTPTKTEADIKVLQPVNFDFINPEISYDETVDRAVELFTESLRRRVQKAKECGLTLVADLSGGFDTRAIVAGLANLGEQFTICNDNLVTGDESVIARQVAERLGKSLRQFSAAHPVDDFSEMQRISYLTDGLVNIWVDSAGFYDELERRRVLKERQAHFMGLGGEFIRQVYRPKRFYRDIASVMANDCFTHFLNISDACAILGLNKTQLFENFKYETDIFSETTLEAGLRHLHFEYYNKVVNAGENRHRMFGWIVSPFWGNDFLCFATKHIRPEWIDYDFFIRFLARLNPRMLEVPFHGKDLKPDSSFSRLLFTMKRRAATAIRDNRYFFKFYKHLISKRSFSGGAVASYETLAAEIIWLCRNSKILDNCLSLPSVQRFISHNRNELNLYQLLTICVYIDELERRFPGRLKRSA